MASGIMDDVGSQFGPSRENRLVVARPAFCCDRMRSGYDEPALGGRTIGRRERMVDLHVDADEGEARTDADEVDDECGLGCESRL